MIIIMDLTVKTVMTMMMNCHVCPNCPSRLRDFELRHNQMVVFKNPRRASLPFWPLSGIGNALHGGCLVELLICVQGANRPFQWNGNKSGARTHLCMMQMHPPCFSLCTHICRSAALNLSLSSPIQISLGAQPWYRFFVLQSKCRNFISSIGQNRAGTIWRGSFRRWLRI